MRLLENLEILKPSLGIHGKVENFEHILAVPSVKYISAALILKEIYW